MPKAESGLRPERRIRESRSGARRNLFETSEAAPFSAQAAHAPDIRFMLGLVAGGGAIPGVAFGDAAKDPSVSLGARWLASFAERHALWRQYDLEQARLIELLGIDGFQAEWDCEQPRTRILTELDERVAALYDERARLVEILTAVPAQSFAGAAAKVAVAHELIEPETDEGNARPLLARAIADLSAAGLES